MSEPASRELLSKFVPSATPSRRLWLVFSARSIPVGKFSMTHIMEEFEGDKLFFNCEGNSWYLNDIPVIDDEIARALASKSYEDVISLGSSMGGYGALLFGKRHKATRVIAFAPNLVLGKRFTHSFLYVKAPAPDYSDLFEIIGQGPQPESHIFFGVHDPGDSIAINDPRWPALSNHRVSLLACLHDSCGFMERREILRPTMHAIASGRPYEVPADAVASVQEREHIKLVYALTDRLYERGPAPELVAELGALNEPLRLSVIRRLVEQAGNLADFARTKTLAEWMLTEMPGDPFAQSALSRATTRLGAAPRRPAAAQEAGAPHVAYATPS